MLRGIQLEKAQAVHQVLGLHALLQLSLVLEVFPDDGAHHWGTPKTGLEPLLVHASF